MYSICSHNARPLSHGAGLQGRGRTAEVQEREGLAPPPSHGHARLGVAFFKLFSKDFSYHLEHITRGIRLVGLGPSNFIWKQKKTTGFSFVREERSGYVPEEEERALISC